MTGELEQRLLALGRSLEVPVTPDVSAAVLARLPERGRHRRSPAPRTLAIALAIALLVAGAAMALPATRHAILRVLGLRGVQIERVQQLPSLPPGEVKQLRLGQQIPLERARHAASFTALLPAGGATAYLAHDVPGGRVSLVIGGALLIEYRAVFGPFIFKLAGPGTRIKLLHVNGGPGAYLSGAPHEVIFENSAGQFRISAVRLAGNVLIWQQGPVTLRIEGTHTLTQALALARSLR